MTAAAISAAAPIAAPTRASLFGGRRAAMLRFLVTALATGAFIALAWAMGSSGSRAAYVTPRWAIWVHLATVVPALPLGAWVLWGRKGTTAHKRAGRLWMAMMMITAIDSFWIRSLSGSIGPVHIFSVLTLVSLPLSVWHARRGNIAAHRRAVTGVYIGLIVASGFAMMPGRLAGSLLAALIR